MSDFDGRPQDETADLTEMAADLRRQEAVQTAFLGTVKVLDEIGFTTTVVDETCVERPIRTVSRGFFVSSTPEGVSTYVRPAVFADRQDYNVEGGAGERLPFFLISNVSMLDNPKKLSRQKRRDNPQQPVRTLRTDTVAFVRDTETGAIKLRSTGSGE